MEADIEYANIEFNFCSLLPPDGGEATMLSCGMMSECNNRKRTTYELFRF